MKGSDFVRLGLCSSDSIVPTDAIWAGDFNSLVDSNGNSYRIFDPLTTAANGVRQQLSQQSNSGRPNSPVLQEVGNPFSQTDKQYQPVSRSKTSASSTQSQTINTRSPAKRITNCQTRTTCPSDTLVATGICRWWRSLRLSGRKSRRRVWDRREQAGHLCNLDPVQPGFLTHTFLNELVASSHRSNHERGRWPTTRTGTNELGFPNPFNATGWPTFSLATPPGGSHCFY